MRTTATDLLIDALAAYRMQRLVTTDQITAPIRDLIFRRYPDTSTSLSLSYLITCPHCTSVWTAAAAVALRSELVPRPLRPLAHALRALLAAAAVTSLLHDTGAVEQEPTHDPQAADAQDPL